VAKIVDFGLVRPLVPHDDPDVTASGSRTLTGTPLYMAPEAMTQPGAGDPRSDLYALGAVGYFLLTGRPVFESANVAEVIGDHLHSEPVAPSSRVGRPLPADLEALILRCLDKNPGNRPQGARALREALRRCRIPRWTEAEAAAWWRAFRAGHGAGAQPSAGTAADGRTLTVDLTARLDRVAV
jgi:serine/threonine protein kinase